MSESRRTRRYSDGSKYTALERASLTLLRPRPRCGKILMIPPEGAPITIKHYIIHSKISSLAASFLQATRVLNATLFGLHRGSVSVFYALLLLMP